MGLDTTHNCWHGPYSAFGKFREQLAAMVGIRLKDMIGFGGDKPWPSKDYEPLVVLLNHSDCDGDIPPADQIPLSRRLREIVVKCRILADDAERFADGLEAANEENISVEFH